MIVLLLLNIYNIYVFYVIFITQLHENLCSSCPSSHSSSPRKTYSVHAIRHPIWNLACVHIPGPAGWTSLRWSERGWSFEDCKTLEEALRNFTEPRLLSGDNQWLCDARTMELERGGRVMEPEKSNVSLVDEVWNWAVGQQRPTAVIANVLLSIKSRLDRSSLRNTKMWTIRPMKTRQFLIDISRGRKPETK